MISSFASPFFKAPTKPTQTGGLGTTAVVSRSPMDSELL